MGLRIELLGEPRVIVDGEPLQVDTRKALALLAYLACHRNAISRDSLALLLWPESSSDRSRAALRRTLSTLRSGLRERWIHADRTAVELTREPDVWIDAERFEQLAESEDRVALAEASDLYRDDFMVGFTLRDSAEFDDWQLAQAAHYRRRAADVLHRLSQAALGEGDHSSALSAARRWLALDPLHEPGHRQLMWIHAVSGDRAAAMRQYRSAVATLQEELGVEPLDETTALYTEILAGKLEPPAETRVRLTRPRSPARPRPPFVGRDEALEAMIAVYRSESPRIVAVTGEPGIGKTRLADEFAARFHATVIRAAGHPHEASIPFGMAIDAVRSGIGSTSGLLLAGLPTEHLAEAARLVPELRRLQPSLPDPPSVTSPGGHARLLRGTAETLLGLASGGLVLLDDLQWADPESLAVFASMVRPRSPVMLVLLYREVHDNPPLAGLIREASRLGELRPIALTRLEPEHLVELMRAALPHLIEKAEEVYRLSEGVPYFAIEHLTTLRDDPERFGVMPRGVRDLLEERMARLGSAARQILTAAAVLGRSFDASTVRFVSGRSEEETAAALEELLEEGVIVGTTEVNGFDFQHDQLRQLVLETTSAPRRARLHARAASSLLQSARRDPTRVAAAVATHLEAAGRLAEAAHQHVVAARHAQSLYANDAALLHFEAALARGYPDRAEIREAIGELLVLAGRYGAALANFAAAAEENPEAGGRLEHKIGHIHARAGEWETAKAHLAVAGGLLKGPELSRLLSDRAWVAHRTGDQSAAATFAAAALEAAGQDPGGLAQAHNVAGMLTRISDPAAARRHLELSLTLVSDLEPSLTAAALNNLALACLSGGDPHSGLDLALEALELSRKLGDRHREAAIHSNIADLFHAAGEDEEAAAHLTAAASLFADIGLEPGSLEPEIWKLTEW